MRKLYVSLCRRWGPGGLTLSAWAHVQARQGHPWLRNRIDGAWLLLFGVWGHCQSSWQRGRPSSAVKKNSDWCENSEAHRCD